MTVCFSRPVLIWLQLLLVTVSLSGVGCRSLFYRKGGGPTRVDTIAALSSIAVTPRMNNRIAEAFGYAKAGDGGGGVFRYDAGSAVAANGGTVIAPKSNVGRWLRIHDVGH